MKVIFWLFLFFSETESEIIKDKVEALETHSSVLAWRILGTGEPGGLLSVELHRVRHNWSDLAAAAAYSPWVEKSQKQWATFTVIESFMQNPSH